jgi:hypothetical protein
MSTNESQGLDAPFIAFHSRFGASETFSEKIERFLARASSLSAFTRSLGALLQPWRHAHAFILPTGQLGRRGDRSL